MTDGSIPPDEIKISIVLPCYNAAEHLPRALDSIRGQTHGNIEIIVVDDGSTEPEAIAYLDDLPADVKLVRQENRGLPGARNGGIAVATGEYVVPLDSDDWLEPEFVEKMLGALLANPDAGYAFSYLVLEEEASGVLQNSYNFFEQLFQNQLPHCIMISRRLWADMGGYDETMRQGLEDWEFNIRLAGRGHHGIVVPEPLFHYRVSQTGMLLSHSTWRHGDLWRDIQRRNRALYRLPALLRTWREWRHVPSTYPLALYFGWLALHRILPRPWFAVLHRRLLHFSHSRRVTRATLGRR